MIGVLRHWPLRNQTTEGWNLHPVFRCFYWSSIWYHSEHPSAGLISPTHPISCSCETGAVPNHDTGWLAVRLMEAAKDTRDLWRHRLTFRSVTYLWFVWFFFNLACWVIFWFHWQSPAKQPDIKERITVRLCFTVPDKLTENIFILFY